MTAPGRRGDLRRSYSFSAASSSNVDRLTMFIAAWSQLPRSNPRRATGKRLLSLVDPTNDRAASYREIQPRGVEEARLWSGAPSPASMTLLQRELDALSPGSCNCVPGPSHIHAQTCPALPRAADMRAALALGEPVSLTLDSFTPSGLGSFPNPVVPFYAIPPDERARRAVVHGSGCMSRNRATRARPAPPMLVHQFVGQTLWLYWPCTPGNLSRLDDASWTGMVSELEQMHLVVLQPGECIFVPSMSSYITLSLGHGGTNMAAHLKYSLVPHQGSGSTTTVETSGIGSVRARSDEDDVRYQQQHRHTTHQHQHQHQHQHHHHHHQQQQNHHQHHHAPPVPASPQPIGHGGGHASAFGGAYGGRYTDMRELEPYPSRDQDSHVQPSRPSFEQRILGWWKRKDRSRERDPMSHTASGTSMGYGGPVAGPSGRR